MGVVMGMGLGLGLDGGGMIFLGGREFSELVLLRGGRKSWKGISCTMGVGGGFRCPSSWSGSWSCSFDPCRSKSSEAEASHV
eukprot:1327492-Amorphochlora_amoeboformis.AAC.1